VVLRPPRVSFAAWRDVGVSVDVLERAGIYEDAVV